MATILRGMLLVITWIIVSILGVSAAVFCIGDLDGFRTKGFGLTAKDQYQIGDTIMLRFEVYSSKDSNIWLFDNINKSLILSVGPKEKIVSVPQNNYKRLDIIRDVIQRKEKIKKVEMREGQPYIISIPGRIGQDGRTGNIFFNFGTFGTFEMKRANKYVISGRWVPIQPKLMDFFKDYTNTVVVKIKS